MHCENIDVFISAHSFLEEDLRGKTAVVIDVLRASSTIVTALHNGAKGVIPVESVDAAGQMARNLDSPNYLMCGEKGGVIIEGYDLGNSPHEYTPDAVRGKTIIFNTTNGTKAVKRSMRAEKILIGSFLNLGVLIDTLRNEDNEIVLVCAGWRGRLSMEDLLCAGNIIYELTGGELPNDGLDGAKVAFGLFEKFGNDVESVLRNSNHAQRLQNLIETDDIGFCCQIDTMEILPVLKEGIISNAHGKQ
ncbi:MAG: 2-phosphosulfolactate phosphatase [Balneolaceae bacterium]|nr:2-phosphosulfolactate phosphatase [Balneolaceae bacterium]